MSFAATVKEELIRLPLEKPCCILAELSALTQTCASLGFHGGGRVSVTWRVQNAALARRIFTSLKKGIDATPSLQVVESRQFGSHTNCELTLNGTDAQRLLIVLRMMQRDDSSSLTLRHRTPRLALTRQCCRRAYLRGIFLGSGTVNDPEKGYHLQMNAGDEAAGHNLLHVLQKCGMEMKLHERRGHYVAYTKSKQGVADTLALIGASKAMLEVENIHITRQLRSNINRASNCDDHNLERTMAASDRQIEAIKQLALRRGLRSLPEPLRCIAQLRMQYPEANLAEIGSMLTPPIGKSGVAHRLRKLIELAEQPVPSDGE